MSGIEPQAGFPQVTSWLQQWPYTTSTPRPWFRAPWTACGEVDNSGWPTWLLDPPPSLINRQTALPVTMLSRLYDEAFWASDFAKFAHESLKFAVHQWEGRPLKSSFFHSFVPFDVLQRSFANAPAAWPWLSAAGHVLGAVGESTLAEWLHLRTVDAAGPAVAARRFHYERRRWRASDGAARGLAGQVDRLVAAARARLAEYRTSAAAADDGTASVVDQLVRRAAYLDQARLVANAGLDVARQAGWEVSSMQFSVSECARLEPGRGRTGRVLQRELDRSGARVGRWFRPFLALAVAAVAEVQVDLNGLLGSGVQGQQQMQQMQVIAARVAAAYQVLTSTQALVDELGHAVDELWAVRPDGQGGTPAAQYTFTLLAERSSDRLHRNRVERLAMHRLRGLPSDSPVLVMMTAASRILARC